MSFAHQQIGKPYIWGSDGPNGFDCSGLTKASWSQAGVYLTHSSRIQYQQAAKVPVSEAQRGDLLFYSNDGTQAGIFHVAIYLGDGQVIHSIRDWSSWDGTKVTGMYYSSGLLPLAGRV
ncbi:C40 family peptidase [Ornithinimicrobium faecis]|uniref:C40 family peptidase n=1 Tax=Ornithinimicrobium faecis TaxID=2934158 RepID=A0ABY4YZU0_9MICO|nr:C40 family peptidase [Ornithinimicrobium sp. HY1793]